MSSSDGKRLFVIGEEPRVELFRYQMKTGRFDRFLPTLSGPGDFSERPSIHRLRFFAQYDALAQPSRRQRASATHVPARASISTAMVARWFPNRVFECPVQPTVEDRTCAVTGW